MKKKVFLTVVLVALIGVFSFANVTLNFIEVLTSPARTRLLKEIIADFEKLNPDIKINLISPPYEQADQKANLMLNTNQPLDIIEVRDYTVKQYINNGKLENLENYLVDWEHNDTLTFVANKAARTVEDTAYLVPQFFFIKGLFIRTDILEELGVNYIPKTLSELVELCIDITDPDKNQYGFGFRGKSWEFKFSDLFATSFLSDIDPSNIYKTKTGEVYFDDPRAIEGLRMYVRLFEKAVPSDGINWGFNEQVNSFVSGTTPFLIQDPDTVALVDDMLGRDYYTVVPVPIGPSGKAYMDYGFSGLGIPSYSQHKEEAWEFIKYISSPEVNAYFSKNYGPLPVHTSTYEEDPYFSSGVYTAWSYMMDHPETYIFATYPLNSEKWPGWPEIHQQDMQSVLLGNMTIEEAAEKWTEFWEE
ncbi:MAG: sugar ABC transporter substrate-binding protein [Kosmotogaceae bacterium]